VGARARAGVGRVESSGGRDAMRRNPSGGVLCSDPAFLRSSRGEERRGAVVRGEASRCSVGLTGRVRVGEG
jgi:hypothetical protein